MSTKLLVFFDHFKISTHAFNIPYACTMVAIQAKKKWKLDFSLLQENFCFVGHQRQFTHAIYCLLLDALNYCRCLCNFRVETVQWISNEYVTNAKTMPYKMYDIYVRYEYSMNFLWNRTRSNDVLTRWFVYSIRRMIMFPICIIAHKPQNTVGISQRTGAIWMVKLTNVQASLFILMGIHLWCSLLKNHSLFNGCTNATFTENSLTESKNINNRLRSITFTCAPISSWSSTECDS